MVETHRSHGTLTAVRPMTAESELQRMILCGSSWPRSAFDCCMGHALGWRGVHARNVRSKGGRWGTGLAGDLAEGWPDLELHSARQRRVIYVECKSAAGKLSTAQAAVLDHLRACGHEVYVWRPDDLERGRVTAILGDRP